MAIKYGESRNIALSIVYYIEECLVSSGINEELATDDQYNVVKGYKNAYNEKIPVISVRNGIKIPTFGEIGSVTTQKNNLIYIDLFARDEAGKSDMRDWLMSILVLGCDYFQHSAETGGEIEKFVDGKVIITNMEESSIKLNIDKSQLDIHDRYRVLITLDATTGKVS